MLQQQTELIIILALSSSKTVREQATVLLSQLNQTESQYLQHFLLNGETNSAVLRQTYWRASGEQEPDILQQAADSEKLKSVQVLIVAALQRLESLQRGG